MKNIIKRILREQVQSPNYLLKVSNVLETPYFYNMEEQFGVTDIYDQEEVMKYIYGDGIRIHEHDRSWEKSTYNSNGKVIYQETSDGKWKKFEYDSVYHLIYFEESSGFWEKKEYGKNHICLYRETSELGIVYDNR
jgi:hypothetical protein